MATASGLKYLYLAYFSRPEGERLLYRTIRQRRPARLVELGMGTGLRATRSIAVAGRYQPATQIRYTGIDLFEARGPAGPGLSIKEAHRLLKPTGARVQLAPGDPYSALARMANALQETDLVIIGRDQEAASLARAWFYVPRMLRPDSLVLEEILDEKTQKTSYREIARADIESRARAQAPRRAA